MVPGMAGEKKKKNPEVPTKPNMVCTWIRLQVFVILQLLGLNVGLHN